MVWIESQRIDREASDVFFAFKFSNKKGLADWAKLGTVEIKVGTFEHKRILGVALVFQLLGCNSRWNVLLPDNFDDFAAASDPQDAVPVKFVVLALVYCISLWQ